MNVSTAQPEASSATGLSRGAVPSGHLAEIEVLRAIAVLMVLVHHIPLNLIFWGSTLSRLILSGGLWDGVDLFFAISGFVIARSLLPLLAGVADFNAFFRLAVTFWIARAWRLLPSSWLWLAAPLPLCLFFNHSHAYYSFAVNWEMGIAGLLDMANFHTAQVYGTQPVGVAFAQWSLSLEEQFYLLLPFAAFFCRRYLFIPLGLLALTGFLIPNTAFTFQIRLWPVALGVLLALWSSHQTYQDVAPAGLAKAPLARAAVLAGGLVCLVSLGCVSLVIVPHYQGPIAVVAAFLVWLASYDRGFLWQPGFARRVLEIIAARSYSLYLVHIPVYFGAHEVWYRLHKLAVPDHRQAVLLVLGAAVALIAVAEANHRLLEVPLRARGKILAAQFRAKNRDASP